MILIKYIKYFWRQYLLYFIFLLIMFMFVGNHIWDLSTLYTKMHPYDYVDKDNTYKLENAYILETTNLSNTFDYTTIEDILLPFEECENIEAYATAIACPGAVIDPERNSPIYNCINYINPSANKVIELKYVYGGWFDSDAAIPQVIMGNFWADYYDAGDNITIYLGDSGEFPYTFSVAGILEQNSAPSFIGINRTGVPINESGSDYSVYFLDFNFLENSDYNYSSYLTGNTIYNMLIKTSDPSQIEAYLEQKPYEISYYYENIYNNFFGNQIFYKSMIFSLLTLFGITSLSYTTKKKLNLLYYIFSLNGMSRRRFLFLNMLFIVSITIISVIPSFYIQLEKCRLLYENMFFRASFIVIVVLLVNVVFALNFTSVSKKKLNELYRRCLEN